MSCWQKGTIGKGTWAFNCTSAKGSCHRGSKNAAYKTIRFTLSEEETRSLLTEVHEAYHTEINDILLTALGLTLKEWTGEDRHFIHLEGHGREDILPAVNVSRTIGWFTSMYPVLLDLSHAEDLSYQIKLLKEELRHIPNKESAMAF